MTNLVAGIVAPALGLEGTVSLSTLFQGLGLDLSNPLDLSGEPVPGINIVTTGSPFFWLKLFGVDLGWVPAFPNSVAEDINNTEYLKVGLAGLLAAEDVDLSAVDITGLGGILGDLGLGGILNGLSPIDLTGAIASLPDIVDLRVPIVVGVGLGAFAAGAAYQQVVDDLPNQPGGVDYDGTDPLLGSFTILPMLLINNPGRANGGMFARFYPELGLLGIDTVTPDTEVQHSGGYLDVGNTGLSLGGANLIPIKLDVTAEYQPMSDFAAWPNPFTLANNAAAAMFPTYILRSLTASGLAEVLTNQLSPQLAEALGSVTAGNPLALNFYLTLPAQTLPLLEPTYLAVDAINLLTGANLNNPIATALSPVLTSLVNLGYTDVYYNSTTGEYDRTLQEADIPTAFGTLPDIDWAQVPGHLVTALATGVQKAIDDGLVNDNPSTINVLSLLGGLLGLGGSSSGLPGLDLSAITDALENLTGGVSSLNRSTGTQAIAKTSFEPQSITSTDAGGETKKVVTLDTVATDDDGASNVVDGAVDDVKSAAEDATENLKSSADDARKQVETTVKSAQDRAKVSAEKARAQAEKAVKKAQNRVNKVAENGRKQIESAVKGVEKAVNDAADKVKQATTPKKKPETNKSEKSEKSESKAAA